MTTFESSHYLLCALGDGALFYFGLSLETGDFFPSFPVFWERSSLLSQPRAQAGPAAGWGISPARWKKETDSQTWAVLTRTPFFPEVLWQMPTRVLLEPRLAE